MKLQELIDKRLQQKQDDRANRVRSGKNNPSNFGRCFRYQFWNRKNEPISNPVDTRGMRVMACGELFHKFAQNLITEYDPSTAMEAKVETKDTLGYCDLMRETEVIEIKSQHSMGFHYMLKNPNFLIAKDRLSHCLQGMFYAIEKERGYLRLVYISKDDLLIQEYLLAVTPFWRRKVKRELTVLNEHWKRNQLPKAYGRAFGKKNSKSNECTKYCPYRLLCKGEK